MHRKGVHIDTHVAMINILTLLCGRDRSQRRKGRTAAPQVEEKAKLEAADMKV
jgi:hypothetical protein